MEGLSKVYPKRRFRNMNEAVHATRRQLCSADVKFLRALNAAYSLLRHYTPQDMINNTRAILEKLSAVDSDPEDKDDGKDDNGARGDLSVLSGDPAEEPAVVIPCGTVVSDDVQKNGGADEEEDVVSLSLLSDVGSDNEGNDLQVEPEALDGDGVAAGAACGQNGNDEDGDEYANEDGEECDKEMAAGSDVAVDGEKTIGVISVDVVATAILDELCGFRPKKFDERVTRALALEQVEDEDMVALFDMFSLTGAKKFYKIGHYAIKDEETISKVFVKVRSLFESRCLAVNKALHKHSPGDSKVWVRMLKKSMKEFCYHTNDLECSFLNALPMKSAAASMSNTRASCSWRLAPVSQRGMAVEDKKKKRR
eukprot:TRINITY_DN18215_c0_g1_i8.p1 TRINITY_DN18215_c0_g1~~TRINITY_DN18215_c0_g1_i8.p1  ORF type:complete len:420 (+),score=119.24 TRINITY_DN18215_c0_g1_i8:161-1261(+)